MVCNIEVFSRPTKLILGMVTETQYLIGPGAKL